MENRKNIMPPKKNAVYYKPPEYVPMIIRVEAYCTACGRFETLYIDENTKHTVEHDCCACGNNLFEIRYRC